MISLIIGLLLFKMTILYSSLEYNLTNGVSKSLLNIKEYSGLSFYIRATASQKAITTITVNNNVSPLNVITTCSYKDLNSNCFDQLNQVIFFKHKGDQLVSAYEYSVNNNNTNYIGIHFSNNKNISYLSITVIVGGKSYDLSSGLVKNIKNLLPSFPYTFKVPIKENQRKINVTFLIINDTTKPFDYAKVNLYNSKNKLKSPDTISYKIANASPRKNNLKLSFYYIMWRGYKDISYANVVVTPEKKIENLKIKIDVDYCFDYTDIGYNADEIYPLNLTNLKSNINYYLHFRLKDKQYANITLSMNKMPSQPFNIVSISHYEDKSNASPKNYSNQIVSFEEVDNKLVANITIDNNNTNVKYATLNFTPIYDIDNINTVLKIGGESTLSYHIIDLNDSYTIIE